MILRLNGMKNKSKIIYRIWLWLGGKLGVVKHHNIIVGKSWLKTRSDLEHSFRNTIKKMEN